MSMAAFQRAYADLAGSPRLCLAVRADPVAALAPYDLDPREHGRLAAAVWQRGMDANCTLYRVTRITPLDAVIPLTLALIRPVLRPVLDAYWEDHPIHDVRFALEAARFVDWLEAHPSLLPEAAEEVVALARRELGVDEARLTATATEPAGATS
jgi:hypothetical protein